MSRFTEQEIAYLQSQKLGRMATVDVKGDLHVVPAGFRYNPETDRIPSTSVDITLPQAKNTATPFVMGALPLWWMMSYLPGNRAS